MAKTIVPPVIPGTTVANAKIKDLSDQCTVANIALNRAVADLNIFPQPNDLEVAIKAKLMEAIARTNEAQAMIPSIPVPKSS